MLTYRKFDKESDYSIMRHIVQQSCKETGHLYPQLHVGDLDFERFAFEESPDIMYKIIWFVYNDKQEIGFVMGFEDEFLIELLPQYQYLMQEVIRYIEENCYKKGITITTDVNSEDKSLERILKELGYDKTDIFRFNGMCDLSKIAAGSPLPEGFSIRLSEEKDIPRRVELFPIPTGGVETTEERYMRMMKAPSYKEALDLVVENEKEEIIAYCTVWNDPVSKIGILEPVACVEQYRRKGIMKSTLLHGMNILKERGAKYVYVGTGGKNAASQALYKSVGFIEHGKNYQWEKTL